MALDDLMEFPSEYCIKVLGAAEPDFAELVHSVISAHAGDSVSVSQADVRASRNGRFVSVNVRFTATSVQQLESIHVGLNRTGRVKYIL